MLNPSFRNPAVLAKMLATLDQITEGRVICSLGAGWLKPEYEAYDVPFIDDHDERIAHEREVVQLLKQLWTHPAPERVTFEGDYVRVRDLAFNPVPYQRPHPPIWIGGDSEATVALALELGDGWVPLMRGQPDIVRELRADPSWPDRPMSVVTAHAASRCRDVRSRPTRGRGGLRDRPQHGDAATAADLRGVPGERGHRDARRLPAADRRHGGGGDRPPSASRSRPQTSRNEPHGWCFRICLALRSALAQGKGLLTGCPLQSYGLSSARIATAFSHGSRMRKPSSTRSVLAPAAFARSRTRATSEALGSCTVQ